MLVVADVDVAPEVALEPDVVPEVESAAESAPDVEPAPVAAVGVTPPMLSRSVTSLSNAFCRLAGTEPLVTWLIRACSPAANGEAGVSVVVVEAEVDPVASATDAAPVVPAELVLVALAPELELAGARISSAWTS